MQTKPKSVINNMPLGLLLAVLLPIITLIIIGAETESHSSLEGYLEGIQQKGLLSSLVSLCAVPNLGLFFLFMWKNNYKSALGVMIATAVMVILVFALKFYF